MAKIKICGLTGIEDINFVNEAKPDYAGFVFAGSKRRITHEQAALFKPRLAKEIKAVGVFVNERLDFIEQLCKNEIIDLIQLHGDENEEYISEVRKITDKPIIKAIRVKEIEDVVLSSADYCLFDAYSKDQYGGTGRTFDWKFVKNCATPFFLAGGLNLDNIGRALEEVSPYCLDVSSGVETNGKKDREKIIRIIKIVRSRCK